MKTIYIDIETFAGDKPSIDDIKAPANYRDEEKIKAYKEEALDDVWRKQALNSMQGKIVCIGVSIDGGAIDTFCGDNEADIMRQFVDFIIQQSKDHDLSTAMWVAHGGLSFDFPWLWHRIKKYELQDIMPAPRSPQYADTMKMAGFTDHKAMYSLNKLCQFFEVGSKDKSGADVHDLVLAGKYAEISDYCSWDVCLLTMLYHKLK